MKKINVAVIGLGNMGKNHARNFFEIDQCNLSAVCDLNEDAGVEIAKKYNCKYYKNYKDLLKNEKIDAVSIVVPTSMHEEVALYFIENKINLFIEKPIANTIIAGKKIILAAKKNKVTLMVGHIERFNPAVQQLRKLIQKEKLGKIISIIAKRVGISPPQIKDANVMIDLGVHDLDIMNYLIQKKVKKITAHAGKALLKDREDHAEIFVIYEDGTSGFLQINWITPIKIRTLSVTGTKGYAELDYVTQELTIFESIYEEIFDGFNDFVVKFGNPKKIALNIEKKEPLKEELKSFINSIIEDKLPLISGKDGLDALKMALDSLEIAKNEDTRNGM